jgi:hypothetical protein
LRRNTMELVACGVIGLGLFMLLQPFVQQVWPLC